MAMTLRLDGDDDRRLTELAEWLGRREQDLVPEAFGSMIDSIMDEHAELMRRLA
ncbi:hypothetical protein ACFO5K_25215 [Nocardia halotolerans]|uniref:FXSXX-COOH protein n=1 Tax=Nocardia halotolerans TaxID=1755878 RepID=A0ABV8VMU4_9NOCA